MDVFNSNAGFLDESDLVPYESSDLTGNRVLVLAPHPDDETIGCGGSLAWHVRKGDDACVLFLTNGAKGDPSQKNKEQYISIRKSEAQKACKSLGIKKVLFWDYEDRALCHDSGTIKRMVDLLREYKPQLVYVPSPMEIHPDHRTASVLLEKSIKKACDINFKVAFYEIGQPLKINALVDITPVLNQKMAALNCYVSQLSIRAYDELCLAFNRFRSMTLPESASHAEGFFLCGSEDIRISSAYHIFIRNIDNLWLTSMEEYGAGWLSEPSQENREDQAMETPLVSVVLPTYNRPDMLRRAIESVLSQTYTEFEVIVVNDGGEEVSGIVNFLNEDGKIIYISHGINRGVSAARNTGLDKATGKYISYLDDDDIFYSNHLKILVDCLEKNTDKFAAVYSDSYEILQKQNDNGSLNIDKRISFSVDFNRNKLLVGNYIPTLNMIHRRDLLKKTGGFDESLSTHEDWDLWIRLSRYTPFYHVREITGAYTVQADDNHKSPYRDVEFLETARVVHNRYRELVDDPNIVIEQKEAISVFEKKVERTKGKRIAERFKRSHQFRFLEKLLTKCRVLYVHEKEIYSSDNVCQQYGGVVKLSRSDLKWFANGNDEKFDTAILIQEGCGPEEYTSTIEKLKSLLTPNGRLIVISNVPDYSRCGQKKRYRQNDILRQYFGKIYLWAQTTILPASHIYSTQKESVEDTDNDIYIENIDRMMFQEAKEKNKLMEVSIAIASDEHINLLPATSTHFDPSCEMLTHYENLIKNLENEIEGIKSSKDIEIDKKEKHIENLKRMIESKDKQVLDIVSKKEQHIGNLERLCKDQISNTEKIFNAKEKHIQNLEEIIRNNETYCSTIVSEKNQHIDNLQNFLDRHKSDSDEIIQKKENHIQNIEKMILDKDHHIQKIQQEWKNDIGGMQNTLEEKENDINLLSQAIHSNERQIADKDNHIRNIESELQLIKNSRAWRWAERTRTIFYDSFLGRFPTIREKALNISRMGLKTFVIKLKSYFKKNKSAVTMGLISSDYDRWMEKQRLTEAKIKWIKDEIESFTIKPKISIVMPVYNVQKVWLEKAIRSVLEQIYPDWELCIADDASTKRHVAKLLKSYEKIDNRIKIIYLSKNKGIAGASNAALSLAAGDFIGFLDHDDELSPDALFECVKLINTNPLVEMIYSDEDKIDGYGRRVDPFFKPDYSPDLLLSMNYICHFTIIKRSIIEDIDGFRSDFDGSQDYDLFLRTTERLDVNRIAHIPNVLYHWRKIPGSAATIVDAKHYAFDAAKRALSDYLRRNEIDGVVTDGLFLGSYRIKRTITRDEKVSIIIPFRDQGRLLESCLQSILKRTDYSNYEILLVDNNSQEKLTLDILDHYRNRTEISILKYENEFNFSAINNYAVQRATGEFILLLNNDMEVIDKEWVRTMVEHAQRKEVGAVGAKLLFPDNKIQHAGVVMGIGIASHAFSHLPAEDNGYFGLINVIRNCSAVTGACLMIRKELYQALGGMDEKDFGVAYNDIDLCLKAVSRGYLIVYTPYARLYHYESATRGNDNEEGLKEKDPVKYTRVMREREVMLNKWEKYINVDPYYNINLTNTRNDFAVNCE